MTQEVLGTKKWVVIDLNEQVFYYPSFIDAIDHLGTGLIMMPEHYYATTYQEIIKK